MHSEYGLEILSVGELENDKDCFKIMKFTHCMDWKHLLESILNFFNHFNERSGLDDISLCF